jgi:23S rRNA (pseudouridine1915-N3)-methyltransferase
LKIKIISIGNKSPNWVQESIQNYTSRLNNYFPIEWIQIKPEKKFSTTEIKKSLEAKNILNYIDKDFVICLEESAVNLTKWKESHSSIAFIIGGSDGLSKKILELSGFNLSLSKMTLPHQLVKIILIEQIFRANSINTNHPYHRE